MIRLSALFVATCILIIAASLAALLFFAFNFSLLEAALVGLTALFGLAFVNAIAGRRSDHRDLAGQIAGLSEGTADLARQVGEHARRIAALERGRETVAAEITAATQPIRGEMRELGALLQQLAEATAAHDAELREMITANDARSSATAAAVTKAAANESDTGMTDEGAASSLPPDDGDVIEIDAASDEAAMTDPNVVASGLFQGLRRDAIVTLVREALNDDRIDLYLQPIVTLPQRKARYYEAVMRLRRADGTVLSAADFIDFADAGGLMPAIDQLIVDRCVRVARRLKNKNREVGLFCNLSAATLADPVIFPQIAEYLEANRALADALILEVRRDALAALGQWENGNLAALSALGFRLGVDHVADLRLDVHDLAMRGCRFVKIPAELLLSPGGGAGDIEPGDLPGLFARLGIEVIAERIERETTVVDLLDFDVKLGQGNLFSPARPVRPEAMQPEPIVAAALTAVSAKQEAARLPVAAELSSAVTERVSALAQMARRVARNA